VLCKRVRLGRLGRYKIRRYPPGCLENRYQCRFLKQELQLHRKRIIVVYLDLLRLNSLRGRDVVMQRVGEALCSLVLENCVYFVAAF
jgi:hypothetical protein